MNSTIRSFLALLTTGCLLFLTAAPPSIGVIQSNGDFQVDGSTVRGNATLFEGSTVQTVAAQSTIQLSGGAEIVLAPGSRVQVYRDRTVLQQGAQSIKNGPKLIEAATLRISPTDAHAVADVVAEGRNKVSIAARQGSVEVRNGSGVLIATVRPGLSLAFDAQAGGAATAFKASGCLVKKGDKYLLTDGTTNVTVELQGPDVAKSAGHQVQITGSMIAGATPAAGATQVIRLVTVDSVGAACGPSTAGRAPGAGLASGAIVAIVGGVAVAGTLVGLGVAGTFSGGRAQPFSRP